MDKETQRLVSERLREVHIGEANVLDLDAGVICYIVMVSAKMLGPKDTIADATRKWAEDFSRRCLCCPAHDRCVLVMAVQDQKGGSICA